MACVIGTMVGGLFEKNLGDTEVLTMFLAIMCLGYLAAETRRAHRCNRLIYWAFNFDLESQNTNAFRNTTAPWNGDQVQQ